MDRGLEPRSGLTHRTAENMNPKDMKMWTQHRDRLKQLFVTEKKTLKQVKGIMETEGFPTHPLTDYEIALRDHLKLRKNLDKQDYAAIHYCLRDRKRSGKESVVLLNGEEVTHKRLKRGLESLTGRRQLGTLPTVPSLPAHVEVITPPSSPLPNRERAGKMNDGDLQLVSGAGTEMVLGVHDSSESPYLRARYGLPFNQFVGLFRRAPVLGNPLPSMSAVPDAVKFLELACYLLSNQLNNEVNSTLGGYDGIFGFMNLIDRRLLLAFFSLPTPAIVIVWRTLSGVLTGFESSGAYFNALLDIGLSVPHHGSALSERRRDFFDQALELGWERAGTIAKRLVERFPDVLTDSSTTRLLRSAMQDDENMLRFMVQRGLEVGNLSWAKNWEDLAEYVRSESVQDPQEGYLGLRFLLQAGADLDVDGSTKDEDGLQIFGWGTPLRETENLGWREPGFSLLISDGFWLKDQMVYNQLVPEPAGDKQDGFPRSIHHSGTQYAKWMNSKGLFCLAYRQSRWVHVKKMTASMVFETANASAENLRAFVAESRATSVLTNHQIDCLLQIALSEASAHGFLTVVSRLLQIGVDPMASLVERLPRKPQDYFLKQEHPLMWNPVLRTISNGHVDILKLLVEHKADLNRHNPLVAVDRFHTERAFRQGGADKIVDFLLQQGVDVAKHGEEAMVSSILRKCRHEEPYTYLCDSLISRGVSLSDLRVEWTPDLGTVEVCGDGVNLLHHAVRSDRASLTRVKFLIDRGVKVHSDFPNWSRTNINTRTILGYVLDAICRSIDLGFDDQTSENIKIAHLLLENGADPRAEDQVTALWEYLREVEVKDDRVLALVEQLVRRGAPDPGLFLHPPPVPPLAELFITDAPDERIHQALAAGADVNAILIPALRQDWHKPLQLAIWKGRLGLAEELIRRGADINAPGPRTPLQASCHPSPGVHIPTSFVEKLISMGAQVNAPRPTDGRGYTALQGAAEVGNLNVAQLLLEKGADMNAGLKLPFRASPDMPPLPGNGEETAIYLAARKGRLDMVQFLLEADADFYEDIVGAARNYGHIVIANLLEERVKQRTAHKRFVDSSEMVMEEGHGSKDTDRI